MLIAFGCLQLDLRKRREGAIVSGWMGRLGSDNDRDLWPLAFHALGFIPIPTSSSIQPD